MNRYTVPLGACGECPFNYDTIECKAPVTDAPHPTYFGDKKPVDCPLRREPITIRIDDDD
jgi:hypothetical protein